jgi:hypothetical protein
MGEAPPISWTALKEGILGIDIDESIKKTRRSFSKEFKFEAIRYDAF